MNSEPGGGALPSVATTPIAAPALTARASLRLRGIAYMVAAVAAFAIMDSSLKGLDYFP